MIIGTGVDLVIAGIFIENEPGIDISDVASDVDFLSKDEDLREVVYGVIGFVGDIDIAIDSEGAIDVHGEGVHEFFTGSITPRDEVATAIKLVEIGSAIHGAETSVSLVIELREAEIVLRRGLIRSETGDGIARISDDGIAETSLEAGENGGADTRDAGFTRGIFAISDGERADVVNPRDY